MNAKKAVLCALKKGVVIPAYNIPYLPMVKPIVQAVADKNSIAMIQVARVEWEKFSSVSLEAVAEEYEKYKNEAHTLLHLDHIPVIDEDLKRVDAVSYIKRAISAGYQSVMIDASRLDLAGNIAATREAADLAHSAGIPCEAELGAVMGHESGEMPPYEEIFRTKKGFTDIGQAKEFVQKSGCDWLSVAVGSIHGAVAQATRHQKKPEARLDIEHILALKEAAGIPLVLHGGSGINQGYIQRGIKAGIAKINVGTEIRQSYEQAMAEKDDVSFARQAVYEKTCWIIDEFLCIRDTKTLLQDCLGAQKE
jgi:fructose-bisphosphate aldolase class II